MYLLLLRLAIILVTKYFFSKKNYQQSALSLNTIFALSQNGFIIVVIFQSVVIIHILVEIKNINNIKLKNIILDLGQLPTIIQCFHAFSQTIPSFY